MHQKMVTIWIVVQQMIDKSSSSLNLGNDEMPIEKFVQFMREEIIDAEYNIVELVDLAWGIEVYLGLDLHQEPMKGYGVNDQPTSIIKLPQAHEYVQLLSNKYQ